MPQEYVPMILAVLFVALIPIIWGLFELIQWLREGSVPVYSPLGQALWESLTKHVDMWTWKKGDATLWHTTNLVIWVSAANNRQVSILPPTSGINLASILPPTSGINLAVALTRDDHKRIVTLLQLWPENLKLQKINQQTERTIKTL